MLPADQFPQWEHARLFRVGYDQLEIKGDLGAQAGAMMDRATALWLGLAQAALATDEPPKEVPDAALLARTIEGHHREAAYDQVIVGYLLQIADELKSNEGGDAEKIRRRVSRLIGELDPSTLSRLVNFGGDAGQRRQFVLDANQSLAVDSVVKVLSAAAATSQQTISHSMTRLLTKLASHAEHGSDHVRAQADTALRENVEALISGWELKDPNPDAYTNVLDAMAKAAPVFDVATDGKDALSGAERLVEMALEVDAFGPIVSKAVSDFMLSGGTGRLLEMLREAGPSNATAERIRTGLTTPSQFRQLLVSGQVDDSALRALIDEMGSAAVDPLLDVLADSDSRAVRRRVFDALTGIGPFVAQRAMERLQDGRWFVVRNMLALLQRLEHLPEDFDIQPYLTHQDHRVRREAIPLALRRPVLRDRTLVAALSDGDERMVRMALLDLHEGVADIVLPTLVNRVVASTERSPEIRAMGAKALASSRSPLALNALLDLATAGKTLFGKYKLAASSPPVLAALWALATTWSDRDDVRDVLEQASRSRDPAIRGAVQTSGAERPDRGLEG
jgi:hypothetical protein